MAARLYHVSPDPTATEADDAARERLAEQWVRDYLDRLIAPLLGFVPLAERVRFREEIEANLEGRREQFELDGLDTLTATQRTLEKLGAPHHLGEAFVYEHQRHRGTGVLARFAGKPVWWAFVLFGQAGLIALGILFARLYMVTPDPNTLGLRVSEIRQIRPEPWPLPDQHPTWYALWAYAFIAPVIAGLLLGHVAPFWNLRPALVATGAVSLLSFSLVSFSPTVWEGTMLSYFQLIWWVPAGTLATFVGSAVSTRRRSILAPWKEKPSL